MKKLKQIFPVSFGCKSTANLIVRILIYIVLDVVLGLLWSILGHLPIIGFIFTFLGSLVGLYTLVGIILLFLVYFKAIR